jgi:hypothetical protein
VLGWACVGRYDGSQGRFEECARRGPGSRTFRDIPVHVAEVRPALQNPVGMLVIVGAGAQKIDPRYALAAGRAAVGLVLGARHEIMSGGVDALGEHIAMPAPKLRDAA